jgi:uncharacterized protein YbaP (TraB family)
VRRALRRLSVLAALLVALPAAVAATDAAPAASAVAAPFLWQVQKPGGARHYLLGSVHVQPGDAERLPAGIDAAYAQAAALVFETDIAALQSSAIQQQMASAGLAADGGLAREVGPTLYAHTQQRLQAQGLPGTFCDAFKAWFCGLMLEATEFTHAGFDFSAGIDLQLDARAAHDGKPRRGLEAPASQIELFSTMPAATGRELLASVVDEADDAADSPQAMYAAWRNNDIDQLHSLVAKMRQRYPEFYERLLAQRNRNWMGELPQIYASASAQLVVVGAAHCVGRDGLVAQLRARGFTVTPVAAK